MPLRTLRNITIFAVIVLLPTLVELLIYRQGEFDLLPWAKLLVHFLPPIAFAYFLCHRTLRTAIIEPLTLENTSILKAVGWGFGIGLLAVMSILGSFFFTSTLVDVRGIASNLTAHGISKSLYPLVALWIALINPFMEEYFWRGFVFYRWYRFAQSRLTKRIAILVPGALFALHHTVIIEQWFSWWQFSIVTVFLAIAGVVFNLLYLRTRSILSSLVAHFMADLAIVAIGFYIFEFV